MYKGRQLVAFAVPKNGMAITDDEMQQSFTLDLETVKSYLSHFPTGLSMCQTVPINNVCAIHIKLYPTGDKKNSNANETYCSLYFGTEDINEPKQKMSILVSCGEGKHKLTQHLYKRSMIKIDSIGWSTCFPTRILQESLKIKFTVTVYQVNNDVKMMKSRHQTIKKALNHNKNDFMVKIIIYSEEPTIAEPTVKKRRYNDHETCQAHQKEETLFMNVSAIMLISASSVFNRMLTIEMKEKKEKTVTIMAERKADAEDMIQFMYTNKLDEDANEYGVLKLAHLYEIEALKKECAIRIIRQLNVENFVKTVNLMERYSIEIGFGNLYDFGEKNFKKIKEQKNYKNLPFSFKQSLERSCEDKE